MNQAEDATIFSYSPTQNQSSLASSQDLNKPSTEIVEAQTQKLFSKANRRHGSTQQVLDENEVLLVEPCTASSESSIESRHIFTTCFSEKKETLSEDFQHPCHALAYPHKNCAATQNYFSVLLSRSRSASPLFSRISNGSSSVSSSSPTQAFSVPKCSDRSLTAVSLIDVVDEEATNAYATCSVVSRKVGIKNQKSSEKMVFDPFLHSFPRSGVSTSSAITQGKGRIVKKKRRCLTFRPKKKMKCLGQHTLKRSRSSTPLSIANDSANVNVFLVEEEVVQYRKDSLRFVVIDREWFPKDEYQLFCDLVLQLGIPLYEWRGSSLSGRMQLVPFSSTISSSNGLTSSYATSKLYPTHVLVHPSVTACTPSMLWACALGIPLLSTTFLYDLLSFKGRSTSSEEISVRESKRTEDYLVFPKMYLEQHTHTLIQVFMKHAGKWVDHENSYPDSERVDSNNRSLSHQLHHTLRETLIPDGQRSERPYYAPVLLGYNVGLLVPENVSLSQSRKSENNSSLDSLDPRMVKELIHVLGGTVHYISGGKDCIDLSALSTHVNVCIDFGLDTLELLKGKTKTEENYCFSNTSLTKIWEESIKPALMGSPVICVEGPQCGFHEKSTKSLFPVFTSISWLVVLILCTTTQIHLDRKHITEKNVSLNIMPKCHHFVNMFAPLLSHFLQPLRQTELSSVHGSIRKSLFTLKEGESLGQKLMKDEKYVASRNEESDELEWIQLEDEVSPFPFCSGKHI